MIRINTTLVFFLFSLALSGQTVNASILEKKTKEIEEALENKAFDSALAKIDSLLIFHQSSYLHKLKGDAITKYNDRFVVDTLTFQAAVSAYNKAIEMDPYYFEGIYARAGLLFTHRFFDDALNDLAHALKICDRDLDTIAVLNLRGVIFNHLGKYEKALDDYRVILKMNSSHVEALTNTAMIFMNLKNYEKAEKLMKKAVELEPEASIYLNNLGFIYLQSEQFEKAEAIFNESLEKNDLMKPILLNNRGFARFKQGKLDLALEDFEASIELYPENSFVYKNLALLQIESGELNKACESLDMAIKLKFTKTYGDEVINLQTQYCND